MTYTVIDMSTNAMFAINLFVTFFTAYYDDEGNLITCKKVCSIIYELYEPFRVLPGTI